MRRPAWPTLALQIAFLVGAALCADAVALTQRTFVGSNGFDGGVCSIALPCRGFAYAQAQTNAGGEIVVLDSGGYGRITITKSLTIVAPAGVHAAISVFAGTNGIDIPTAGIKVVLRGLSINGQGGAHGVYVTGDSEVAIERCDIGGMASNGIFLDNVSGSLQVRDSVVHDNAANGVMLFGPLSASLDRVSIERNALSGIAIFDGGRISVKDSTLVRNNRGVELATLTSGGSTRFSGDGLHVSANNHQGIKASTSVGFVYVRLTRSTVDFNAEQGVWIALTTAPGVGGALGSFSDNVFASNATNALEVSGFVGIVIARNVFAEGTSILGLNLAREARSSGDNLMEPGTIIFNNFVVDSTKKF